MPISPTQPISRLRQSSLFFAAGAWFLFSGAVATRAARGLAERFDLPSLHALLGGLIALFLIVLGFRVIHRLGTGDGSLRTVVSLPLRSGFRREWGVGAAIGWGLALATVLPLMLSGNLSERLVFGQTTVMALVIGIATLLTISLLEEVVVRGYLYQRLAGVVGKTLATLALSLAFGISLTYTVWLRHGLTAVVSCTLFGMLLTLGYLRTHALWVPWGLHFAYRAVVAILFGLPVVGRSELSSVVDGSVSGPRWLTGGAFGLDGALWTIPVLLVGFAVLYAATREYAWNYTHPPIVAAGYEVTVAPPAAHVAMERQTTAVAPPPLVQILPATPQGISIPSGERE